MNRIATAHRFSWLSVGRIALGTAGAGLLALCTVVLMATGSWLVVLLKL